MPTPLLLDPGAVADDLIAAPKAPPISSGPDPEVIDTAGRIFDPKLFRRHHDGTPFRNVQGEFMPRGARKNSNGSNGSTDLPAHQEKNGTAPSAEEVSPGQGPIPSTPEINAWGATERRQASGIPEPAPAPPSPEATPPGASVPAPPIGIDTSEDAAELATRTLYFTAGCFFGDMEEATPDKLEHENLRQSAAAYIRTLGWRGTAGTLMLVRVAAYLLKVARKPKGAATVKKWLEDFKTRRKADAAKAVKPEVNGSGRATHAPVSLVPSGRYTERAGA